MLESISNAVMTVPGAIQRYFEVALYLLVVTAFATLASTGGLDLPALVVVTLALFVRGYLLAKRRDVTIPAEWTSYLTLGYVAFYLADYFLLSRSFVGATVHLVLFGMLVRLFSMQRERDHYTLAILAFLMVLAAAVLTVDSLFLFAFAVFLLVAIVTFMLMEMRHSMASPMAHARGDAAGSERRMAWSLATMGPLVLVIVFLGGAAIFFVLPRVSSRYLSSFATTSDLQTGFSDHVQLGSIGQIQQSTAVIMRVRIDGDTRGAYDLKWRGIGLSNFNGHTWSNPFEQRVIFRTPQGRLLIDQTPPRARVAPRMIHYRVMMEPNGTSIFFLAPQGKTLEGDYRSIAIDNGGAVFNFDSEHPVTVYEADSDIAVPAPSLLRESAADVPANFALTYLQLPALDIRISKLAEQITATQATSYDKAAEIERYLQTNYGYTLQLPRTVPRDPLSEFLFVRKRGHCEYFASAMAVMLRTLNIPSRVVNGFRTSEFNDLTGNYVIRASSAHSWVEAYFGDQGWVSFDPTPAAPLPEKTTWNRFLLYIDAASSFWREWVVNYDATHQRALGHDAVQNSRAVFDTFQDWTNRRYQRLLGSARRVRNRIVHSPARWALGFFALILLSISLLKGRAIWLAIKARGLRKSPGKAPQKAATLWYEHMTRLMAKRGWKKSPFDTPSKFLQQIDEAALRSKVQAFTEAYELARFGESAKDAESLPELYDQIEDVLKPDARREVSKTAR
jgi:transglutaminase-like putative cysteine protease